MADDDGDWILSLPAPAMALVGALVLAYGLWQGHAGLSALRWPSVEGRITRAEVFESGTGNDPQGRKGYYDPVVKYDYSVGGVRYEGHNVRLSAGLVSILFDSHTRASAAEIVAPYTVGASVEVRYKPSDPATAVLQPGASGESKLALVVGVLALAGAAWRSLRSS